MKFLLAVTPEPDSTEDSTCGFDPSDLPDIGAISSKDPTRRMSQPVTGSVTTNDKSTNRRASEGKQILTISFYDFNSF